MGGIDFGNAPRLQASEVALNPEVADAANVQDALDALGGMIPAVMNFGFGGDGPYAQLLTIALAPLVGGASPTGNGAAPLTVPATMYAAGIVVGGIAFSADRIPDSADALDLVVEIQVVSLDAVDQIVVQGQTTLAAHATDGTFDLADLALSTATGTDLSYDAGAHTIVSAAGGAYGIFASCRLEWD